MKQDLNIFKILIYKLKWIFKNQQYKNDIILLLEYFFNEDTEVNINAQIDSFLNVEITKQNGDMLKFIFSNISDDVQILYIYNKMKNIEYRSYKKRNNCIEVEEIETNIVKHDERILSIEKVKGTKKYIDNHLLEYSFSDQTKNLEPNSKKSFSYYEKMYVMPCGKAFKKIDIESEENSSFTPGTIYIKTDSLIDDSFNNSFEYICENQVFDISNEEEYNIFYLKYKVSLISNVYISVVYKKENNTLDLLSGILISSDDKTVKILVDDDQVNIDYNKIISITSGENVLYQFDFNDSEKIINYQKMSNLFS